MAVQIQLRRDTAANWTSNDPTLAAGEFAIETDTDYYKIGDGSTAWTSLGYSSLPSGTATLASPTFTGVPAAPTASANTSTTQVATTAFVMTEVGDYAPLASPTLTGTPAAPTASANTNTTQVATTAFVMTEVGDYAPLASPTFTGTATAGGINAPIHSVNTQTGTSYTLVLGDANGLVDTDNGSANTVTVPPNSSVAFPVGTQVLVVQQGSGQTTIVAGSGVSLRAKGGLKLAGGSYAGATLVKRATDDWYVIGSLEA